MTAWKIANIKTAVKTIISNLNSENKKEYCYSVEAKILTASNDSHLRIMAWQDTVDTLHKVRLYLWNWYIRLVYLSIIMKGCNDSKKQKFYIDFLML